MYSRVFVSQTGLHTVYVTVLVFGVRNHHGVRAGLLFGDRHALVDRSLRFVRSSFTVLALLDRALLGRVFRLVNGLGHRAAVAAALDSPQPPPQPQSQPLVHNRNYIRYTHDHDVPKRASRPWSPATQWLAPGTNSGESSKRPPSNHNVRSNKTRCDRDNSYSAPKTGPRHLRRLGK